ncbi:MAG TPA: NAD(P)/FAD-dependent oxidoreductase [Nitrososphaeraceae archaeon]|nr:NAD(P)/FAD-dependent oxidoreductase [Nitrososphaeraceae archaeon]
MLFDCAIIGGGPAGLNAALILGRARRNVILFDNNNPRNAVTQESHGFITRDGIKPKEFREIAHEEIGRYPYVVYARREVTSVIKNNNSNEPLFELLTSENNERYQSKTIIISTGLRDVLPSIDNISDYYGRSLFHCPYCDGWELRDKPLVVIIGEQVQGFHFIQTIYNWSKDLVVCTNGTVFQNTEQKHLLQRKGIKIIENKIKNFVGENGQMEKILFENGKSVSRKGGFVMPQLVQSSDFGKQLGCQYNSLGGIAIDSFGRTNIPGVYAAGDASVIAPAQLIIAAAEGVRAAAGVNTDLTQKEFLE